MNAALKQQAAAPGAPGAEDTATIERKVQDLAAIAGKLVDVLRRENEALRENSITDYNLLVDEKTALTRMFEVRVVSLSGRKADLSELNPEMRGKMRDLTQGVSALIEENGRRLHAAIDANKRVVEMVRGAVKENAPGPSVYSANGRRGSVKTAGQEARDMSLSFNSVL
ncbi:MAG: hypothetical protein ACYYKD_07070 [Rhodospirillales bacterium]